MKPLLILSAAMMVSLVSLAWLPLPFIWIGLVFSLAFAWVTVVEQRDPLRFLSINLAVLSIALGLGELYLSSRITLPHQFEQRFVPDDGSSEGLRIPHRVLGYAPRPDSTWTASKRFRGQLIYEVRYTIDSHGLRVAPDPGPGDGDPKCILFFGGSFAFGEGLNDDETLPFYLSIASDFQHHVHNFAFSGYGPHQTLAALESGPVSSSIECSPSHAFLLTMAGHIPRPAGLEPWDQSGPRYLLAVDGNIVRAGHFDDDQAEGGNARRGHVREEPDRGESWIRWWHQLDSNAFTTGLERSFLFRSTANLLLNRLKYSRDNLELCLAIVNEIQHVLATRFDPSVELHVIFFDHTWDGTSAAVGERFLSGLEASGVEVHEARQMLPDWRSEEDTSRYQISPYDVHPNALANSQLADFIAKRLIR